MGVTDVNGNGVKEKIRKVAVLGAGDMGHGIAEVCAIAGYEVTMRDIKHEFVERGMSRIRESLAKLQEKGKIDDADEVVARIKPTTDMKDIADADLVIEAVPEIFEVKTQVFAECEELVKRDCIFASNTSTMKITELAKATRREDKFAGLHFFNPPVLMKLVEIIKGERTSDDVLTLLSEFVKSLGKVGVVVRKDVPGFIVNRITAPSGALLMCMLNKAEPEEIDAVMKRMGLPMGPFELMDYTGVDVFYHAMRYYAQSISKDYEPPEVLEKMLKEGNLGKKSGRGWYDWSRGRPSINLDKASDKVNPLDFTVVEINEAVKLVEMEVAKPEDIDLAVKLGLNRPFGPFEFAKSIGERQILERLLAIRDEFEKDIFEPAKTIKDGKLMEMIELNL
jgi:enoyl-CoA hydratase/3-hydroxyacyl-CoA dehydrogenase